MFDTISRPRPHRPAAGTALSLALHVMVIGAAVWFTMRIAKPPIIEIIPHIFRPGPKGAAAPPSHGPSAPPRHGHHDPRPPLPRATATPAPETAAPVAPEPANTLEENADSTDEIPGEIGSGTPGGDSIGSIGGPPGGGSSEQTPQPFEDGRMTPPHRLSGPDPVYTVQALEREIEGDMAVRCIVTEQGTVHSCRVLKSLPFMDAAAIRALEQCRYTPALIGGRPVAVDYLFNIHLQLP
jgi:TonB family protein